MKRFRGTLVILGGGWRPTMLRCVMLILISLVGVISVHAKCNQDAHYAEYREIYDTFIGDHLYKGCFQIRFHADIDLFTDSDDEEMDWSFNAIHFHVDVDGYDFFDKMIDIINGSLGAHHKNSTYDIEVEELFTYGDDEIEDEFVTLSPTGSYRFEITEYRELMTTDLFVFCQDGLTFSSQKFLYPIFRKIKDWYITDYWHFDFGKEYFQWTFEVFCGQIVKAELLIEYGTDEVTVINLLDDSPMIGYQKYLNRKRQFLIR